MEHPRVTGDKWQVCSIKKEKLKGSEWSEKDPDTVPGADAAGKG